MVKSNTIEITDEELLEEEVNLYHDGNCADVTRVHCLTDCFFTNDCMISCDK